MTNKLHYFNIFLNRTKTICYDWQLAIYYKLHLLKKCVAGLVLIFTAQLQHGQMFCGTDVALKSLHTKETQMSPVWAKKHRYCMWFILKHIRGVSLLNRLTSIHYHRNPLQVTVYKKQLIHSVFFVCPKSSVLIYKSIKLYDYERSNFAGSYIVRLIHPFPHPSVFCVARCLYLSQRLLRVQTGTLRGETTNLSTSSTSEPQLAQKHSTGHTE